MSARKDKRVVCQDCGESRIVRRDVNPKRCRKCSGSIGGRMPKPNRRTGRTAECDRCGKSYWRRKSESGRRFCGKKCADRSRRKYSRSTVECKQCGIPFESVVRPYSNSSGIYCSLECRNKSYLGQYRGHPARNSSPRYSRGWRRKSRTFQRNGNDFCIVCGVRPKRLSTHHIWANADGGPDDVWNLISLCPAHHPRAERISESIAKLPVRLRMLAAIMVRSDYADRRDILRSQLKA